MGLFTRKKANVDHRIRNCHSADSPSTNHNSYDITVHVNGGTTNKLEVEAAWTLTLGFVSLFIFSLPIFLVSLAILFCDRIYGDCTQSTWIIPYFRELILVHTTYKSVLYICQSRDLFSFKRRT